MFLRCEIYWLKVKSSRI